MAEVSVIMAAYNVEEYIENSVYSVMNQTMKDIELVIVNDASTDGTWDKILELQCTFGEKIQAINLEKNMRQGGARNTGIKAARGDYVVFVDSDDWIKQDMIEKFYDAMITSGADLVGTGSYYMFYDENNIKIQCGDKRLNSQLSGKNADKDIRDKYFFCVGGVCMNMYKRHLIIDKNIWFPEGLSYEDNYFVNLYLCYVKKYVCVNEAFYYYRQHEGSTVHRKDFSQLQRITVEKLLLSELKKRNFFDEVKSGYELMCIQRWYINTLGILYANYGKNATPYAVQIGKEFRTLFPDYGKNEYYRDEISFIDRLKLRLFEMSPALLQIMYSLKRTIKRS